MQRITNINDWMKVEDGTAINFEKTEPRLVRLVVNSFEPVSLDYVDTDGVAVFLARVQGRDVVEFTTPGEFALLVNGGDLWLNTVDGEKIALHVEDPIKFTKLIERRARNPELEAMQRVMMENTRRLLNAQSEQLAVLVNQRVAAATAAATVAAAASNAAGSGGELQPNEQPPAGGQPPAGDGGSGSGGTAKK